MIRGTRRTKYMKITLTDEEKECIKGLVHNKGLTEYAFIKSAELARLAEQTLMKRILELWPNAIAIDHPPNKEWTITLCDDIKKKKEA
jgi:hypothetical protein